MNTKTEQISSGLVAHIAAFKEALNGTKGDLDAWLECNDESEVRQAIFGVISDAEAIIAAKDAEIMEQCRLNGMGAERELALLGQIERQSAALKLARDALQTLGQYYAWLNFGECRTYGEHVPIVDMRLADLICKEALAAIDSLQEGE